MAGMVLDRVDYEFGCLCWILCVFQEGATEQAVNGFGIGVDCIQLEITNRDESNLVWFSMDIGLIEGNIAITFYTYRRRKDCRDRF